MNEIFFLFSDVAWPLAVLIAWITGELGARWLKLPRISIYGLVGFVLAFTQTGFLPRKNDGAMLLLANIAFGLILFELGYRINLRWLRVNPWVGLSSLVESIGTFFVVYIIADWYEGSSINSFLLGSLAMSTSPVGILRVINDQRSSGQVTERILHLSVINCFLSVFVFNMVVGYSVFINSGNLFETISISLTVLSASVLLGGIFGLFIPSLMLWINNLHQEGTQIYALAIVLLVAITHAAKFSPILASLIFGVVARQRSVTLSQAQLNFGVLGELLTVLLFVFALSKLEWQMVWSGFGLGLTLIAVRFFSKTLSVLAFSSLSGISWNKGLLSGLALAPISVFVILVLEQTRYLGISFIDKLSALSTMTLFLEIVGPAMTQMALVWAKETDPEKEH